jgi:collagenase-like PrtC family protease
MEMKAKATDNVTSVKLNVIKLFTCTQVLVLEIRKNITKIGIRVLKLIHRIKSFESVIRITSLKEIL